MGVAPLVLKAVTGLNMKVYLPLRNSEKAGTDIERGVAVLDIGECCTLPTLTREAKTELVSPSSKGTGLRYILLPLLMGFQQEMALISHPNHPE
ncbi:hypothetical protein J6590_057775 [Homalodisca vitripennis]|nr:hypothetical protein J6590_057775 [Homalodisca vitripennis]